MLDKKFNHHNVEKDRYNYWLNKDLFNANLFSNKKPYSIILPPPNVTGKLHLGHAWDGTLQDILIRYKHMNGYETLWIPGMDHAGIATQAKIDQRLKEQGISRYEIGREAFLEQAWNWKSEYADIIRKQWAKMGFALDYSKEKFTLDIDVNKKINEIFTTLYDKGLIYRGNRITNWDPFAKTALSDIEVIYKETQGKLYYLKYFLENSNDFLIVATTRPETIFGDQALCVNPNDERYKDLIGKNVIIPGVNRVIPIISDEYVEMDFGSGIVKITPAHDPNDYEIGLKYDLPMPIIMNLDGTMNELCGKYANLDRFKCREQLINDLNEQNLVEKIEDYVHNVGYSERSDVVVETILSKQWFVKMQELANNAIQFQQSEEKIKFYPERFENTFLNWMNNVQDWCISRQLWWGHRIPAWYHKDTGEIYVGETAPSDIENYVQDEDVLDTWFSSALWPMATTIWQGEDFAKFYPTNILITGYDIIFFWVSRMIFQAIEFSDSKPFDNVLIHGLIRASDGRKMSKSLGNGVDPMDVIEEKGVDALRLFLVSNSAPGLDLRYNEEKLDASWNFLNKLWNVSRLVLQINENINTQDLETNKYDVLDLYIIKKFNFMLDKVNYYFEKYEFGEALRYYIHFIREEFSSWYLEGIKFFDINSDIYKNKCLLAKEILINSLKILHPVTPFITDAIFENIDITKISLFNESWPESFNLEKNGENFELIKGFVGNIRTFREKNQISPKKNINVFIKNDVNIDSSYLEYIKNFANVTIVDNLEDDKEIIEMVLPQITFVIINENLFDVEQQKEKLNKEIIKYRQEINRSIKILSNDQFIKKAAEDKINIEKEKANDNLNIFVQLLKEDITIEDTQLINKLKDLIDKL